MAAAAAKEELLASDANFSLAFASASDYGEPELRYAAHMTNVSPIAGTMIVHSNYERATSGEPFSPPGWLCKGFSKGLSPKTAMQDLVVESDEHGTQSTLFHGNWFGRIDVAGPVRLPDGMGVDEVCELVRGAAADLSASEETRAELVEFAETVLKRPGQRSDAMEWPDVVDGHGHFLGLYKCGEQHFLAVHTNAGAVGHALNGLALHHNYTVGEFYGSEMYQRAADFAKRRAERQLNRLALVLGIRRSELAVSVDTGAYVDRDDPHAVAPSRVAANYASSLYNVLHPVGKDLVYYSYTTRLDPAVSKRVVYLRSPEHGFDVVELSPTRDYTTFAHRTSDMLLGQHGAVHRLPNPHASMPIGPGRCAAKKSLAEDLLAPFAFWRGDSVPARLLHYGDLSERKERILSGLLGEDTKRQRLTPVAFIHDGQE